MAATDPILIAGGGIAGLATALALAQRGEPVRLVERRETPSEDGAGIQISPNGVHVLRSLGVADRLAPHVGRPEAIEVRDGASGRILQRLPLGDWFEARHGAPYWAAHRQDVQAALLAACAEQPHIQITTGFETRFFDVDGSSVRLHDARERTVQGRALIGADGVFSRVRQQLHAVKSPRFSGRTAARAVLPVAARPVGTDARCTTLWIAPGAHVVQYAAVRGDSEIPVVVIRTEAWQEQGWSAPVEPEHLRAALAGFAPALREALARAPDWRRWALFEIEPLAAWSHGPVTLAGDAAHPVLPFLAQGGSLALEDAATLAVMLGRHGSDAMLAFKAYDAARRERARRIAAIAQRNGWIFHLSGLPARLRNLAMRHVPPERVMAGYDWVYGWRPPG